MSYSLKEVQRVVSMLLEYSMVDEAFLDMGTQRIGGKITYNDIGERNRQVLVDFINDTSIEG